MMGSRAASMAEVCDLAEPRLISSWRSGAGNPNSAKNTAERRSSKCWPVWTRLSWCSRRSGGDPGAALMNCGRLPITVRPFMTGRARAPGSAAELLGDAGRDRLARAVRDRRWAGVLVVVDRGHRLDLADGGGEEDLVGLVELLQGARALLRSRDLDDQRAGDGGEDVLVERRGGEG